MTPLIPLISNSHYFAQGGELQEGCKCCFPRACWPANCCSQVFNEIYLFLIEFFGCYLVLTANIPKTKQIVELIQFKLLIFLLWDLSLSGLFLFHFLFHFHFLFYLLFLLLLLFLFHFTFTFHFHFHFHFHFLFLFLFLSLSFPKPLLATQI